MESHVRRASGMIIKPHAHALFCIGPCLLTRPRRLKRTNRCVTDEWIGVDDRMSTIELVARQQANATGAGAKPKDPMMQPAGPGLPPLFVWLPKLHSRKAFYILWWILSGIVAVLVLLRLLCFLRARSIQKRVAPLRSSGPSTLNSSPASTVVGERKEQGGERKEGGVTGWLQGLYAGYRNWAHVRVPLALFPAHTATEYFWTAVYIALVIGLTMWGSVYKGKMNYTRVFGLAVSSPLSFPLEHVS